MAKRMTAGEALAGFDPTPEEIARAERAKPLKRPMCIKCKAAPRVEIWQTAKLDLDKAFLTISDLLSSTRAISLSRDEVRTIRLCHDLCARASKARYCKHCIESAVSFTRETVDRMRRADA